MARRISYSYCPVSISLGKELEGEVIQKVKCKLTENCCRSAGEVEDVCCGTDLYVYGLPIDLTYNFRGKDHMSILPGAVELMPGIKIRFGVRTGNTHLGHTKFAVPVLVIGIDGANDLIVRGWMDTLTRLFSEKIDEIIEVGQSGYWDWTDRHGIDI